MNFIPKNRSSIVKEYLVISMLYFIILGIYTFPLIVNFGTSFIGEGDAHIFIFNAFNFHENISNGESPFYTKFLLHPEGESMLMHTSTLTMSAFSSLFSNQLLGVNLFIILSFVVSGVGAYILANQFFKNKLYAFVCGFIFAFSSYKTARLLGHYNLLLTATIPFCIYYFLLIVEQSNELRNFSKVQIKTYLAFLFVFQFQLIVFV